MSAFVRFTDKSPLPDSFRGAVVAIGNFDGVHRGHRAVLERAIAEARARGVPALALTFEPHPRSHFRPEVPVFRLTPAPLRARLLDLLGMDGVVELRFDGELAEESADDFVAKILEQRLGVSHVVTGFDFHFGKGRRGGPAFLMEAGRRHGFGATLVDAFRDEASEIISSSAIRRMLANGDLGEANAALGYHFSVQSEIGHGQKLGRTLGFPTANMALPEAVELRHGIYAVRLRRADGSLHDGVASFGRRPTVENDGAPLLETYLFDFAGNLYGETAAVSLFSYLRPELKFDGLDPLVEQMRRDADEARALLAAPTPIGPLDAALCF